MSILECIDHVNAGNNSFVHSKGDVSHLPKGCGYHLTTNMEQSNKRRDDAYSQSANQEAKV